MYSTIDELATFRFNQQSTVIPGAPRGQVFYGDAGIPRGMMKVDKNNFAPRIGVAIRSDRQRQDRDSRRLGLFYAVSFANITSNLQGQPFLIDVTVFGTPNLVDPWANVPGGSPFPYTLNSRTRRSPCRSTANYFDENAVSPTCSTTAWRWSSN